MYSSDDPCGHPDNDQKVRVKAGEDPSGLPVPLTHAIGEGTRVFKMQEQRLAFERRSPCMHGMHAVHACHAGNISKSVNCILPVMPVHLLIPVLLGHCQAGVMGDKTVTNHCYRKNSCAKEEIQTFKR